MWKLMHIVDKIVK